MNNQTLHLHLVSDSTGETIDSITKACLVQFEGIQIKKHRWNLVRSQVLLQTVLNGINENKGLVFYTFVDENLRAQLESFCREKYIPCISVLRPVLRAMIAFFGKDPTHYPGRQHKIDEDYLARIDAVDFAMDQDDGQGFDKLKDADVIIIGVSRTSKTPTCIYLAGKGIRAANIPFVPECPMPEIEKIKGPLIVGLTKDAKGLVEIRKNRINLLNEKRETNYTDIESVESETREARKYFTRLGCPVIDVSKRSVEETASEIIMLLENRKNNGNSKN